MNVSAFRPSGLVIAAEDIIIDVTGLAAKGVKRVAGWVKAKSDQRRINRFYRDAQLAGVRITKIKAK